MNCAEPCARIAARSSLSGADAAAAVEGVVPATASPPERAGAVNIAGWGSFADRHRAARRGGNPRTREAASIPVRAVVAFAAGRAVATGSTIGMARPAARRLPHGRRGRSRDRRPPAIAAPRALVPVESRLLSRCSAFATFVAGRSWE